MLKFNWSSLHLLLLDPYDVNWSVDCFHSNEVWLIAQLQRLNWTALKFLVYKKFNDPEIPCQGSMGVSFRSAHPHQTQRDAPCGLDVAARASPDQFFSQHGLIQSEMVQNTTQYGLKYLLKKNTNFKLIFYLVLVSNFRYCILIYEHLVMVMYSLYYLLLLLNWYMFTIILKKMLSNYRKYK